MEKYKLKVNDELTKTKDLMNSLNDSIEQFKDYIDEIAKRENKIYQDELREEEVKKKLQENTGSISTATGQTKKIIRDLEDIEKSEQLLEKNKLPVLDFSKSKDTKTGSVINDTTGVIIKQEEEIEKTSEGNLIKEVTGDVIKTSGSIKRSN